MSTYPFYQVDVFSAEPTKGNPVAVVIIDLDDLEADGSPKRVPTDEQMQSFASWTNLTESTFLYTRRKDPHLHTNFDYELRIWTSTGELPFAGHPTLGSCQAWLKHTGRTLLEGSGNEPIIITQRCKIGDIKIRLDPSTGGLAFLAPALVRSGPVERSLVHRKCDIMGIDPSQVLDAQWVANGPNFFAMQLDSAETVLEINCKDFSPDEQIWGIFGEYKGVRGTDNPRYEVRLFDARIAWGEDPVTGSFHAGIATLLGQRAELEGRKPENYVASQGTRLGRKGRVTVSYEVGKDEIKVSQIWVGGIATVCVAGSLLL